MASVEITDLGKSYGPHAVLRNVSISIRDGEFVALVGSSGCGKSTLLRMVAGLETITSGTVSINKRVVNDVQSKNRDIAMVFQNYALYPHLTVAENMGFSLRLRSVPKAEMRAAVEKIADTLGLGGLLDRYPKQLSGGQRQRVAMGRAIVRDPQVFLFDEPLSNLDAQLRVQMRGEVKALQQRLGTTSIYVTHDQMEAMTMSDRIVVLNQGSVEQIGAPLELYDRPANLFVARFIGSPAMNLISGRVRREVGGAVLDAAGGIRLRLSEAVPASEGQELVFGIRPEHIEPSASEGAMPLRVSLVEMTGAETHIHGTVGESPVSAVLQGRYPIAPGETLLVEAKPDCGHLFDAASGARIAHS